MIFMNYYLLFLLPDSQRSPPAFSLVEHGLWCFQGYISKLQLHVSFYDFAEQTLPFIRILRQVGISHMKLYSNMCI